MSIIKHSITTEIEIDSDLLQKLLVEKEWPKAKLNELLASGWTPENILNIDNWSKRYLLQGAIWGEKPSRTAQIIARRTGPSSRILEIGFGYGRDMKFLLDHEHSIHGIEEATEGLTMATAKLREYKEKGKMVLIDGDVKNVALLQNHFEAAFAHRMLHLIKPKSVSAFVNRISGALREDGLLVLTARNHKDFNPKQMERIDENTAKYTLKGREGHYINFWDEKRFRSAFNGQFNRLSFHDYVEPESVGNPDVQTNVTMMIAHKMSQSEMAEQEHSLEID